MKTTISIAVVATLAATAPASAEPRATRFDAAVGVAFLWQPVEDHTGNFDGYALDAGVRHRRWFVFASFQDYADNTEDMPGTLRRAGLSVRHDRADVYMSLGKLRIDVGPFFETGVGYEWLASDTAGRDSRPDVTFAVGGSMRLGPRQHDIGMEMGVRFVATPEVGGMFFVGIPFSP